MPGVEPSESTHLLRLLRQPREVFEVSQKLLACAKTINANRLVETQSTCSRLTREVLPLSDFIRH